MAALKSRFLVLALVLVALAGASGTASAQVFHPGVNSSLSCVAAAVPAQSRAEGIAELLGDIVVQCTLVNLTGGVGTGFPPSINANVAVTLNVNVTNNIDFGAGSAVTDSVLIVNEVFGTAPITPTAASTLSGVVANTPLPQYGTRTSVNTIQWSGVILPVPTISGNPGTLVIRVSNMRGNVSGLGIPTGEGSFPSAQVIAFISVSSQTAIPVTNNVLNIGIPLLGLITRFRGPDQADVTLPIVALQCITQNVDSDNNLVLAALGTFTIRLSEGYASAFKTLGVPTVTPAAAVVEDGFPTPPSGVNGGGATQGTRFLLRFFNVPNGVRIGTPHRIVGTATGGHTLTINKVAGTDANGAGTLNTTLAPSNEITITGGFGYAVYEVVDSNPFVVENVVVPVTVGWRANTSNDLPAVGTLQASASFAPISTVTTSNRDAPEPRFVDTGRNTAIYTIARCATNLLFPFVTNQSGFDTGIAISNTTRDDKGTTAQAGSCTLYYFGSTTGGGAAPPQQTSAVVAAGGQIVFTVSGGNSAQNIAATPGFQGYMMASCQFLFAHGFAFITDGFGGVPTIAEGYLALVVPWNGVANGRIVGFTANGTTYLGESLAH